jgi:hypothetical protein
MPGFMPGTHVLLCEPKDVDGRDKPGHDDNGNAALGLSRFPAGQKLTHTVERLQNVLGRVGV